MAHIGIPLVVGGVGAGLLTGHIIQYINNLRRQQQYEDRIAAITDLYKQFHDNVFEGPSGNLYIHNEKVPQKEAWLKQNNFPTSEPWAQVLRTVIEDFKDEGKTLKGLWSDKVAQEEHDYITKQEESKKQSDMSYIKEEHEPPVILGKKAKMLAGAVNTAAALAGMQIPQIPISGDPSSASKPEPNVLADNGSLEYGTDAGLASLPREEWLFKGNMFHWTTIRFPIRKIAQIPECDVYKPVHYFGDNDNVFLLDNFTMYPWTCWMSGAEDYDTYDTADLAFGSYKKWRVKRIHMKLSQFKTVTSRQMVVSGQNRTITGEDAHGRILYASDQSGCVQVLPLRDKPSGSNIVNTKDFIKSSIAQSGAKVRAQIVGNPLYWEDVRWMNENSKVILDYKFDDTYLGRVTWFKRLWEYTWSHNDKAKPWGRHNLWLIPGINTTGDRNRQMVWPGRTGGEPVKFFNWLNKSGPICLCVPRTGEYSLDESRPKFSASCLIEGYMDVEVAMGNWGNEVHLFGYQSGVRNKDEIFMKYQIPAARNEELKFGDVDLYWNNIDPSEAQ